MSLLFGTEDGVYRAAKLPFDDATNVLDAGRVMRIKQPLRSDSIYACSKTGLYRSTNRGETWSNLAVPREEVYSSCTSPDGERLYAGTHPAHLYVSGDSGASWLEVEGFQELPSRENWFTPRHRNEAHIRSLETHPDTPNRVIAAVEVGGVHISDDHGETWHERRNGVHDDVHHVLVRGPEEYIASCGDGLYRTRDAGQDWTRLDGELSHRYFRETIEHEGRLYTAAARSSPGTWEGESGADAGLFISDDDGDSFRAVSYPGEPEEVVLAWAVVDNHVIAGTNDGSVLRETADTWELIGKLPTAIRSLCTI